MKAKYEVWRARELKYSCVTTTRNTEDMIGILSSRYLPYNIPFKIIQIQNGNTVCVYNNLRMGIVERRKLRVKKESYRAKAKPVIDNVTGTVYKSINYLAGLLKMPQTALQRQLNNGNHKGRYSLLQNHKEDAA